MSRTLILGIALVAVLAAAGPSMAHPNDFSLQVGPPIAATVLPATGGAPNTGKKVTKNALFVVRPVGCTDPADARILATAEGVVDGARRRMELKLEALSAAGVHAVWGGWSDAGVWIVSLSGTCGGRIAGAIVSIGPRGAYRRDAVTLLTTHPTSAQVDRALDVASASGPQSASRR